MIVLVCGAIVVGPPLSEIMPPATALVVHTCDGAACNRAAAWAMRRKIPVLIRATVAPWAVDIGARNGEILSNPRPDFALIFPPKDYQRAAFVDLIERLDAFRIPRLFADQLAQSTAPEAS